MTADPCKRLIAVTLDPSSIGRARPEVEHERAVAIYDLLEENRLEVVGHDGGPYRLILSMIDGRLVLEVFSDTADPVASHILSLTPFRKIVKDYRLICESYYEAIRSGSPNRIEAIDMARRGIHNDGSEVLQERLEGKIVVDFDTARRLFTLICVLHWRG